MTRGTRSAFYSAPELDCGVCSLEAKVLAITFLNGIINQLSSISFCFHVDVWLFSPALVSFSANGNHPVKELVLQNCGGCCLPATTIHLALRYFTGKATIA